MCITEQKLVDAYANGNPHERFSLIYKNYAMDEKSHRFRKKRHFNYGTHDKGDESQS